MYCLIYGLFTGILLAALCLVRGYPEPSAWSVGGIVGATCAGIAWAADAVSAAMEGEDWGDGRN